MTQNSGSGFELTRAKLITAIVALLFLTAGCFTWAALTSSSFMQLLASALASTFLSISVATLVTEVALKPVFVSDLLAKVGLKNRLSELGVVDVAPMSAADWRAELSRSNSVELLLVRPAGWLTANLDLLLDAARRRPITVTVYLADPTTAAAHVARNLGLAAATYAAEITQAATDLELQWKTNTKQATSTLAIELIQEPPFQDSYKFDGRIAYSLTPLVPDRNARQQVITFTGEPASEFTLWANERWKTLTATKAPVPLWTDR